MFREATKYAANVLATAKRMGLLSATDFVKLGNLLTPDNSSNTTVVTNFNTITKSGHYNGNNATGAPIAGALWFYVIHTEHTGLNGYSWQLAIQFALTLPNVLWQRQREGGTWGAWYKVIYNADSGWLTSVTFGTNWADFPSWGVRYRKLPSGMVILQGLAAKSSALALPETMFTLPAGYRPGVASARTGMIFECAAYGGRAEVRVLADGKVGLETGGSVTFTSVNGIAFFAEN